MKKILFLRHPPLKNSDGLCIGQTDAEALEYKLSDAALSILENNDIKKIYSSDLQRCQKTAESFSAHIGAELVISRNLREISFGDWENRSWDEISENDPQARKWFEDIENIVPPGGEALDVFTKRVMESVAECASDDGEVVLIVTHAGVIRAVIAAVTGNNYIYTFSYQLDYNGITGVEWNTCYGDSRLLFVNRNG